MISIPIEELQYGIRRAVIADRALLASAAFILEVGADMEAEALIKSFRTQSKLGPQDRIRELVVQALPGIIAGSDESAASTPLPRQRCVLRDRHRPRPVEGRRTGRNSHSVRCGDLPNLAMTLWALKG